MNIQAKPVLLGLGALSIAATGYYLLRHKKHLNSSLDRLKPVIEGKKRSKHYWEIMHPHNA